MSHVWVKHDITGAVWACPEDALPGMKALGWEPTDERPVEPNPAVDERIAWQKEQAEIAAAERKAERERAAAEKAEADKTTDTKPTRAARRGESEKE